jgi:TetR/AcrR family transcriptional repressor of bet genes
MLVSQPRNSDAMARPPNTDARREQIARALFKVMAIKGYQAATTGEVATEAGLSRGVVHYHFKNKLEILLAMFDVLVADPASALDERLKIVGGGPVEDLRGFIEFHLALGDSDPDLATCWIALGAESLREPALAERYQAALLGSVVRVQRIIEQGVETGVFKCPKPRVAAAAIIATIQGYLSIGGATNYDSIIPWGTAAMSLQKMAEALVGARILARSPAVEAPLVP